MAVWSRLCKGERVAHEIFPYFNLVHILGSKAGTFEFIYMMQLLAK